MSPLSLHPFGQTIPFKYSESPQLSFLLCYSVLNYFFLVTVKLHDQKEIKTEFSVFIMTQLLVTTI